MSKKTIFVIHGRNTRIRDSVFAFLRAIGLKPREWSELLAGSGSGAPFIGDMLQHAFSEAKAVVAVLTPDDVVQLRSDLQTSTDPAHEKNPTGQARPNVLFEMGLAFGQHPERTILLEVGSVRPFSDVSGRFVVRIGNDTASRNQLVNLLEACGCRVDRSGADWLNSSAIDLAATGVGFDPPPSQPEQHCRVLRSAADVLAEEVRIVGEATKILATTGSRSRDRVYLDPICRRLAAENKLVHYRVLMGPLHNQVLKNHLKRLFALRDPKDRSEGFQTLFVGMFGDALREPEKFICANEHRALVILPSLTTVGGFDTALVYDDPTDAAKCVNLVRQLYQGSDIIDTLQQVEGLHVLRGTKTPSVGM